jgi:signal transduction histidine kinase
MAAVPSQSRHAGAEHEGAIARLSHELRVPLQEVRQIYGAQLERLGTDARIRSFLGVLARRKTRDILRAARRSGASQLQHDATR